MDVPVPVAPGPRRRAPVFAVLSLGVAAAHAVFLPWLGGQLPGAGWAPEDGIQRMNVAFVRELLPRDPEPVVPGMGAAKRLASTTTSPRITPRTAGPAASAVEFAAAPSEPARPSEPTAEPEAAPAQVVGELPAESDEPPALVASAPLLVDAANPPASDTNSASSDGGFEWPVSTRLSYHLEGDFRGPVQGWAQVDWLRQGSRYQVHLDVRIAGIVSRRLSSEGLITEQGLQPERYQEETQILFAAPRHRLVRFDAGRVFLANGRQELALPEVQDTASQFVQLSWLFSTQSHRLNVGELIVVPLALPTRMDRWSYTVHAQEDLSLPVGVVPAFHLKPQRTQARADELTIDTWFAPSLQYLPVRILIRQDAQTFLDLTLSRLPQQASADAAATR
jgi:hypothetical protein